ncbi:MAG: HAD family phosphatase [Bacteroidales bacterium]|nr:HAD family phosphatase [Clostridium sp.]MCM1204399.1 HAD family phosphatase [Bacteroidales bacterium]
MQAFIFDFNGTMVMDSYMHETAWRHYVEELCHRRVSEEEFKRHVHGKTSSMILEHFLGKGKLTKEEVITYSEEKEEYYRKLCLENADRFHLTEGLPDFLDWAKEQGIPMTIATAANLANVNFYFDYFSLERWFDSNQVVYDDATLKGKPNPDIYLRAMERLSAKPEDCVVFEDAVSGVTAAFGAGAGKIIGVYGDSSRKLLEESGMVDFCIRDFREGDKLFCLQKRETML